VQELNEYMAEHPPVHMILAAVHMKPKMKRSGKDQMLADLKGKGHQLPEGVGIGERLPEIYRKKKDA
jgi:hypothetical protein